MENKSTKIDKGRVEGICKDIKKFKTLEGLKKFLSSEIKYINEVLSDKEYYLQK